MSGIPDLGKLRRPYPSVVTFEPGTLNSVTISLSCILVFDLLLVNRREDEGSTLTFIVIPGVKGKVFKPEERFDLPKKHPCKNCYSCQLCSDDRCTLCRTLPSCAKDIRLSDDTENG